MVLYPEAVLGADLEDLGQSLDGDGLLVACDFLLRLTQAVVHVSVCDVPALQPLGLEPEEVFVEPEDLAHELLDYVDLLLGADLERELALGEGVVDFQLPEVQTGVVIDAADEVLVPYALRRPGLHHELVLTLDIEA